MPRNIYSELHIHITWHTKENGALIEPDLEAPLYEFLRDYARQARGVVVHASGGIDDHVHVAVTVPPTLLLSE